MRGKAAGHPLWRVWLRITPAYAGKSAEIAAYKALTADHPRMCGEKTRMPLCSLRARGSPPHVRGKASQICSTLARQRITPACAGKSKENVTDIFEHWDHPRMCGEKLHLPRMFCWKKGSPPHVRGKVLAMSISHSQSGITPACAGKRGVLVSECLAE